MNWFWLIPLIILGLSPLIYGYKFWFKYNRRRNLLGEVKNGQGVLTNWNYTREEWAAAQDHFEMRVKTGDNGKVSFTPRYIFVSNGRRDLLWELIGEKKYERHLTEIYLLKDSPMNVIKFTVRTKRIKKDQYGNDTMDEICDLEEFYVPVPKDYQQETEKVMSFYKKILDDNADAVAAVMPFGLGLFR